MWWVKLIYVAVGGLVGLVSGVGVEAMRHQLAVKRDRRALAGAFAGEIGAICAMCRRRQYLEGARAMLGSIRETGRPFRFQLRITQHYFEVYQANAGRLGLLPGNVIVDIPLFYAQAKSLLEDVSPDSFAPQDAASATEMLQELISILEEMLRRGEDLVTKLKKMVGD